jgi:hypothetical protein
MKLFKMEADQMYTGKSAVVTVFAASRNLLHGRDTQIIKMTILIK